MVTRNSNKDRAIPSPDIQVMKVVWMDPRQNLAKKTFTPTADGVLLQPFRDTVTDGGLELPDSAVHRGKSPTAIVIAVGPEVTQVKEGDEVAMSENTLGTFICVHGQPPCGLFREGNLCGVVLPEHRIKVKGVWDGEQASADQLRAG